ncbi:MAG TPA: exo-beta-N-acetylmuramidase NamZ domain-containing protein, partial [Thermodesulfovibrionales bacterium]|nr:exo-beta-N-acetylmuramidase NamZ domain-containing protein [Thermodesulfovibrionales bacterium]
SKDNDILSASVVERMTTPHSPPGEKKLRGLGWVINSASSSDQSMLFPLDTYGHTGYTGTSMWVDPVSGIYGIILTNRVHPEGKGDACPLRGKISLLVEKATGRASDARMLKAGLTYGIGYGSADSDRYQNTDKAKVQTGIDVLEAENFETLSGVRVGLITNHSGLDSAGRRTMDLFYRQRGLELAAIFTPEHGLSGKLDEKVASSTDTNTGLPVYSLYGDSYRPTGKMLDGIDALVFDVQDAGVRFYTYITTMGYAMEEAAKRGIAFYVLDRPNPITASTVQGPIMDENLKSFVGYFPLPVRYGMTIGELAKMFNAEFRIGAKLHVIKMRGYDRSEWYDETGLPWVSPSPNLRSLTQAILYPGVAMVEGANVSVGRGTDTPFELLGAPWIKAKKLASYLNKRMIQGVVFKPVSFIPKRDRYKNKECHGVRVILTDRKRLDPTALGVEITSALYRLFKKDFQLSKTLALIGSREVLYGIREGRNPSSIARLWQGKLEQFLGLREKYLLY